MASSYALPTNSDSHHSEYDTARHGHHHSHTEAQGRANGPLAGLGINGAAFNTNSQISQSVADPHSHSHFDEHVHGHAPSKSKVIINGLPSLGKSRRARGESDLGRPPSLKGNTYRPTLSDLPSHNTSNLSRELLAASLICLAFFTASLSVPRDAGLHKVSVDHNQDVQYLRDTIQELDQASLAAPWSVSSGLREALLLSSAILLGTGLLATGQRERARIVSSGYTSPRMPVNKKVEPRSASTFGIVTAVGARSLGVLLPVLGAVRLGGWRSCLIVLSAHTAGIVPSAQGHTAFQQQNTSAWRGSAVWATIAVAFVMDMLNITSQVAPVNTVLGYSALVTAIIFTQSPLLPSNRPSTANTPSSGQSTPVTPSGTSWKNTNKTAPSGVVSSFQVSEPTTSLWAALLLFVASLLVQLGIGTLPVYTATTLAFGVASVVLTILTMRYAKVSILQHSQSKTGFSAGVLGLTLLGTITSQQFWPDVIGNVFISALFFASVMLGATTAKSSSSEPHGRASKHHHGEDSHSSFTLFLLNNFEDNSLIHSILCEKDSRRIAYFTCLNFLFMLVQGLYGYLSGSLGLLSDTVHMFFDCLGLIVGLGAAVASKWPPSRERPYGWGKLNTLAGFGNGVFLMLVSVEFVWEAIEGMLEGRELRRVKELFVVSTLGLLVNLVGLFAFGHAHAGHDHSHGHSHDHKGEHEGHHHGHDHNENMHGIFLHVAADAGGSLAVIISTAVTIYHPWYLWDPLATIIIAILIFAAAVPLVISSGQKLLLIVPEETEYIIKNFLQEVGEVRGVLAYAAPRFWTIEDSATPHEHGHEHNHDHVHSHEPEHTHGHNHHHDHHDHDHKHEHHHAEHDHTPHEHSQPPARLTGCLHVTAVPFADLEDVRERIEELALSKGMQLVIHVEYDGEAQCWCASSQKS